MAGEFNSIGNPILATGLGRLFSVDMPRVGMMSPDIQLVTSLWERPEFWALAGGALGAAPISMAAAPGFTSFGFVFNPPGSGVLLITESFGIVNQTAGALTYLFGLVSQASGGAAGTVAGWTNRDLRRAQQATGAGGMSCVLKINNSGGVAYAQVWGYLGLQAGESKQWDCAAVCPPGWGFAIAGGVANQAVVGYILGRERPAPQTELSLY